jgi:hypothetical protein
VGSAVQLLTGANHTPVPFTFSHVLLMLPADPAGQAAVHVAPTVALAHVVGHASVVFGRPGHAREQLLTTADQLAVLLTPSTQVLLMLPAVPSGHWPVHTAPGNALLQLASQFVTLSG